MISKTIKSISEGWIDYRKECEDVNTKGHKIKKVSKKHPMYNLIRDEWTNGVSKHVDLKKYKAESKLGDGLLSAAPWLAVMDKTITESATEGYYIVYLFSRSAKKLYLCMGIGATQFQDIYGTTNKCIEKLELATNDFNLMFKKYNTSGQNSEIDLLEDNLDFEPALTGTARNLNSCYEKGTFFRKEYDISNLNDEVLIKDLNEYINIYSNIVDDPRSENIDFIAETTLDEDQSISKNKKTISVDYIAPSYEPRQKKNKKTSSKQTSTVHYAKKKRRTQESKKIGKEGEQLVYKYEYEKLKKIDKENLAKKIIMHCEINEYPGWDITSYDKNENLIYIEVKSTKGNAINQLDITRNEWEAAKKEKDNYFIYLVNNALNEKKKVYEIIQNPSKLVEEKIIDISTAVFELKL